MLIFLFFYALLLGCNNEEVSPNQTKVTNVDDIGESTLVNDANSSNEIILDNEMDVQTLDIHIGFIGQNEIDFKSDVKNWVYGKNKYINKVPSTILDIDYLFSQNDYDYVYVLSETDSINVFLFVKDGIIFAGGYLAESRFVYDLLYEIVSISPSSIKPLTLSNINSRFNNAVVHRWETQNGFMDILAVPRGLANDPYFKDIGIQVLFYDTSNNGKIHNKAPLSIDVPFKVGTNLNVLKDYYGAPSDDSYYLGGRLVTFGEDFYFLDSSENVNGFIISKANISIFGTHIGMTPKEISSILSSPVDSYYDEAEFQDYVTIYHINNYTIYFCSDSENTPTKYAIVLHNTY